VASIMSSTSILGIMGSGARPATMA
jgi:hypothetical protein